MSVDNPENHQEMIELGLAKPGSVVEAAGSSVGAAVVESAEITPEVPAEPVESPPEA